MTQKEAIKDWIAHWERMIAWVEKQRPRDCTYMYRMVDAINECWDLAYCPLCKLYSFNCTQCPMGNKYGACNNKNSENLYGQVHRSLTWKKWLKYAKEFLKQLKSLLEEQPCGDCDRYEFYYGDEKNKL